MLSLRLNIDDPEFEALAQLIRDFAGLDFSHDIKHSTLFEDDLGITGDDGGELLEAVAQHYNIELATVEDGYRKTFGLAKDEFLFHSEGFFGGFGEKVHPFTVGELFSAVQRARQAS